MSKYYTPEIEEFHVGFECEFKNSMQSNKWEKEICDVDTVSIAYNSFEHEDYKGEFANIFRVKYLDKEDIESLGFELIESDKSNYFGNLFSVTIPCKMGSLDTATYRLLLGQHSKVCLTIIESNSYGGNEQNMCLTIKNKSELKKLLKQLGI